MPGPSLPLSLSIYSSPFPHLTLSPSMFTPPELKQAKAHERPPAALKLARFLPRKLRERLAQGGGAEGGGPTGGYARAPAGPASDPDKRE